MIIEEKSIDKLRDMLSDKTQKIVVVSHSNPDGDAIGSALAWRRVLEEHGCDAHCVVPNKYPYFLEWMSDISKVHVFKDEATGQIARTIADADLIFCLDFNLISRLESLTDAINANTKAKKVLIDHHLNPPVELYDLIFSHVEASSTSYLVYKIIERLYGTHAIDYAVAESLYVGMMTDTGNFSFSNLTADLYRAVAHLVECGIDIPAINNAIYNSFSESRMRLLGYSISSKMEVIEKHGVAYITLTENELRRFKFQMGDSEGFVNYPLSIRNIRMSAMFTQTTNFIRISLRSRGDVNVNLFAGRYFDGGGHKNASGGKSFLSLEQTIEKFRAAIDEFFAEEAASHNDVSDL